MIFGQEILPNCYKLKFWSFLATNSKPLNATPSSFQFYHFSLMWITIFGRLLTVFEACRSLFGRHWINFGRLWTFRFLPSTPVPLHVPVVKCRQNRFWFRAKDSFVWTSPPFGPVPEKMRQFVNDQIHCFIGGIWIGDT